MVRLQAHLGLYLGRDDRDSEIEASQILIGRDQKNPYARHLFYLDISQLKSVNKCKVNAVA